MALILILLFHNHVILEFLLIFLQVDFDYLKKTLAAEMVKGNVRVQGKRHTLIATPTMLENLAKAKHWYVDVTFNMAHTDSFKHLLTLSFFARSGKCLKLFPGCFIVMQGKKKEDYCEV